VGGICVGVDWQNGQFIIEAAVISYLAAQLSQVLDADLHFIPHLFPKGQAASDINNNCFPPTKSFSFLKFP
jgi:hypothetical protein